MDWRGFSPFCMASAYEPAVNVPDHVHAGIDAMAGPRDRAERDRNAHQRSIERLTAVLARPRFLYATLGFVAAWIGLDLLLVAAGAPPFDPPPFHYLHLVLTTSAMVMATMVLITQDRQIRMTEKYGHLDLQINLLAEGKIAKVIALLEELRCDLPNVRNRPDVEAGDMAVRTDPQVVIDALEESLRAAHDPEPPQREPTPAPGPVPAADR